MIPMVCTLARSSYCHIHVPAIVEFIKVRRCILIQNRHARTRTLVHHKRELPLPTGREKFYCHLHLGRRVGLCKLSIPTTPTMM